jgi:hypothetical protein
MQTHTHTRTHTQTRLPAHSYYKLHCKGPGFYRCPEHNGPRIQAVVQDPWNIQVSWNTKALVHMLDYRFPWGYNLEFASTGAPERTGLEYIGAPGIQRLGMKGPIHGPWNIQVPLEYKAPGMQARIQVHLEPLEGQGPEMHRLEYVPLE